MKAISKMDLKTITPPKIIKKILEQNKLHKIRLTPRLVGYDFEYPTIIFSENKVKIFKEESLIKKTLRNRNIYYFVSSQERKNLIVRRIGSLKIIKNFINQQIIKTTLNTKIISIAACGSYIYASNRYIPNDIDILVFVEGNAFHCDSKIPIPKFLSKKLDVPIQYLSLNFYGRDNIEKGILVGKKTSHKDTEIKREASMGYRRSIVIQGKDFILHKNDLNNIYAAKTEMLVRCYLRLIGWGRYGKESKIKRINKLASRLYSLGIALNFFDHKKSINLRQLSLLPILAQNKKLNYDKIVQWYEIIVKHYNLINLKYHERTRVKNFKYQ